MYSGNRFRFKRNKAINAYIDLLPLNGSSIDWDTLYQDCLQYILIEYSMPSVPSERLVDHVVSDRFLKTIDENGIIHYIKRL